MCHALEVMVHSFNINVRLTETHDVVCNIHNNIEVHCNLMKFVLEQYCCFACVMYLSGMLWQYLCVSSTGNYGYVS